MNEKLNFELRNKIADVINDFNTKNQIESPLMTFLVLAQLTSQIISEIAPNVPKNIRKKFIDDSIENIRKHVDLHLHLKNKKAVTND